MVVGTALLFPPYFLRGSARPKCGIRTEKANPSENAGIFLCSDYGGGLKKQEKPETNAEWPEESERKRKIPVFSRPCIQKSKIKTF